MYMYEIVYSKALGACVGTLLMSLDGEVRRPF